MSGEDLLISRHTERLARMSNNVYASDGYYPMIADA